MCADEPPNPLLVVAVRRSEEVREISCTHFFVQNNDKNTFLNFCPKKQYNMKLIALLTITIKFRTIERVCHDELLVTWGLAMPYATLYTKAGTYNENTADEVILQSFLFITDYFIVLHPKH